MKPPGANQLIEAVEWTTRFNVIVETIEGILCAEAANACFRRDNSTVKLRRQLAI